MTRWPVISATEKQHRSEMSVSGWWKDVLFDCLARVKCLSVSVLPPALR